MGMAVGVLQLRRHAAWCRVRMAMSGVKGSLPRHILLNREIREIRREIWQIVHTAAMGIGGLRQWHRRRNGFRIGRHG